MLNTENVKSVNVPIRTDKSGAVGAVRVGESRVSLLSVLTAFQQGNTPEQIVHSFPTLELSDVYAVVVYYLGNRDELDAWLEEERAHGDAIEAEMRRKFPQAGIRERLLARKASADQGS